MTTTNTIAKTLLLAGLSATPVSVRKFDAEAVAVYDALVAEGLAVRIDSSRSYWLYKATGAQRREDAQSAEFKAMLAWDLG